MLLTRGNKKLGDTIWSWSLPSGYDEICVGKSGVCHEHCYDRRLYLFRRNYEKRLWRNYELSRREDFADRMAAFVFAVAAKVVRVHVGGDFYSAAYAREWLDVMRRRRETIFYFYTRSWRVPDVAEVLAVMARRRNVHAWYSCDRETGCPARVPRQARLCWMSVAADDLPPPMCGLTFRIHRLRRHPQTRVAGVRVCPEEDGVFRREKPTCEKCRLCWTPPPTTPTRRALPLIG